MGLASLFQKKANYFDKKIPPQCSYCQFGTRSKEGGRRIICDKKGIMEETASCNKFVYSPLKRIPVKQLNIEGALTDDEMYVEVKDDEQPVESKAKAPAEKTPDNTQVDSTEAAPSEDPAQTEDAASEKPEEHTPEEKKILDMNDLDAVMAEFTE